jgi:HK97 family phage major capsid protein
MGIRVLTSRKNMIESSIDALTLVEQDVMKSLKVGLEKTIFNGSGGAPTPTGILQNSGVGTVTRVNDAGNGADLTYQDVLNFESTVANANAEAGSLGFLTTPGVRAKLKQTPKNGSGYPEFIWETGDTIIGHMAETTTNMPSGLTKGTNSNLHSVIYGNWEDAVLALWTGIDVFLDPYTSGAAGAVIFQAFQEVDVELLHGGSFCVSSAVSIA